MLQRGASEKSQTGRDLTQPYSISGGKGGGQIFTPFADQGVEGTHEGIWGRNGKRDAVFF